jgi:hypothetical protein
MKYGNLKKGTKIEIYDKMNNWVPGNIVKRDGDTVTYLSEDEKFYGSVDLNSNNVESKIKFTGVKDEETYTTVKENKMARVLELMVLKEMKLQKIFESNGQAKAFREISDDLLLGFEMLIDKQYGNVDVKTFKESYSKLASTFEKQFQGILKAPGAGMRTV